MVAPPSDSFIDRLQRSYVLAIEEFSTSQGDIWSWIDGLRKPIHDALIEGDRIFIRNMLADPITTDLFYGVDNLAASIDSVHAEDPNIDQAHSDGCKGSIVLLSNAIGALRWVPDDAEQYHWYRQKPFAEHDAPEVNTLLDRIEAIVGFPFDFPAPFRGERGCLTERGLSSFRAIAALYQAFRLKQELALAPSRRVLEIGPGMGRTAYYAHKTGAKYTTVDLPLGIVAQACFLGATLGPDALWLVGDMVTDAGRIRLLPSTRLKGLNERFDLVLNVDSLTEMGQLEIAAYADWIATHADTFLSINQEANEPRVPEVVRRHFPDAHYRRFPYWMRPGYAEEIIRLRDTHAKTSAGLGYNSVRTGLVSYLRTFVSGTSMKRVPTTR